MSIDSKFTLKLRNYLNESADLAVEMHHVNLDTSHVISIFLRDKEGSLVQVIRKLNISIDEIEEKLQSVLQKQSYWRRCFDSTEF